MAGQLGVAHALHHGLAVQELHKLAVIFAGDEFHHAVHLSKQGMILAYANTDTCMETSSALTNDDIAWDHDFATKFLNAEALAMGFASVFGTTYTFFMCHDLYAHRQK